MASSSFLKTLAILSLMATISMAQQPSSGGASPSSSSTTCTNAITSLSPCLAFITANSSASRRPSASCCSQLSNMVQATPQCLCTLVNGGGPSFITINRTMAISLPGACKSRTPPLSQCIKDDADAPGSSPESSPSPAESTNETPNPSDISPTESDVPFTDDGSTSDAIFFGRSASVQAMTLGLLIAALATF
ncbi:Non-specific lipid transfer protein GPI-anchored 5 [Linum perenne]